MNIGKVDHFGNFHSAGKISNDKNGSFAKVLMNALKETNAAQLESERLDTLFAAGLEDDIAKVTTAAAKADISLTMTLEITNKLISAYNEIMRIQL